jgi:hypothetical protein
MLKAIQKQVSLNGKVAFFALSMTSGIYIAISELHRYGNKNNFLTFSIALLAIFLVEIYSNWFYEKNFESSSLVKREERIDLKQLFYIISIPVILYLSLIAYGYYNLSNFSLGFVLLITFFIFLVLFVHVRNFFDHNPRNDSSVTYIFDVAKFLNFFLLTNVLANLLSEHPGNKLLFVFFIGVLSFITLTVMLWQQEKLHKITLSYNLISSVLLSLAFFLLNLNNSLNALQTSFAIVLTFYLVVAIIHHKLENTLNKEVLFEYLVVIILILSVSYGIS